MAEAKRDNNGITTILGLSNADGVTPLSPYIDSSTNRLLVSATTDIGVAEDSAHASGATGVMMLAVRQDTQADFGADGDYVPFSIDADGALRVSGGGGGTQYTEGDTDATIVGNAMMMEVAANTLQPVQGTVADGLLVNLGANNDVVVTNAGTFVVQVDGSALTALQNIDTDLTTVIGHVDGIEGLLTTIDADTGSIMTAVQLLDDAIVADDAAFTPATTKVMMAGFEYDDTGTDSVDEGDAGAARISANRNVYIQIRDGAGNERGAAVNASNQLSVVEASAASALTALQIMDDWDNTASDGASVSGDVAHDAADAGEPVKIGYKAYAFDGTAPQTASAEADRVNAISDLQGIQYVQVSHPAFWHVSVDYASAQTNATVKAAPGAGSLYITDIFLSNGATAGNVTLLDGSGGTVLWEAYPGINGGAVLNLRNPIKLTATTLLAITSTTVTTHSLTVCGFIA